MANLDGFDATQVDPNVGFEPVPAGAYPCIMTDSEYKETKNKDGEYLQCTWEIIEGEYARRLLFERLNLKNKNETAVKIAMGTLSAICHAVGVLRPKDSAELHNKPALLKVELEERNDKPGSFSNRIKGYSAVNGSTKAASDATAPEPGAPSAVPPWKKK